MYVELSVVGASVGLAVLVGACVTGVGADVNETSEHKVSGRRCWGGQSHAVKHPPLQPVSTGAGIRQVIHDTFIHVTGIHSYNLHWRLKKVYVEGITRRPICRSK